GGPGGSVEVPARRVRAWRAEAPAGGVSLLVLVRGNERGPADGAGRRPRAVVPRRSRAVGAERLRGSGRRRRGGREGGQAVAAVQRNMDRIAERTLRRTRSGTAVLLPNVRIITGSAR